METDLILILVGILAFMLFLGLFLWSVLEEKARPLWLVGAAVSLAGGIAGFLLTR